MPDKDLIAVVCHANYCRSPVAERLLRNKLGDKYLILSAGLSPMVVADMDERSKKFLKELSLPHDNHLPQKITEKIMKESNMVFAMDLLVLGELNRVFAKYKEKIKLLNYQLPKENLYDPFKFNDDDYNQAMNKIKRVVDNIDINN